MQCACFLRCAPDSLVWLIGAAPHDGVTRARIEPSPRVIGSVRCSLCACLPIIISGWRYVRPFSNNMSSRVIYPSPYLWRVIILIIHYAVMPIHIWTCVNSFFSMQRTTVHVDIASTTSRLPLPLLVSRHRSCLILVLPRLSVAVPYAKPSQSECTISSCVVSVQTTNRHSASITWLSVSSIPFVVYIIWYYLTQISHIPAPKHPNCASVLVLLCSLLDHPPCCTPLHHRHSIVALCSPTAERKEKTHTLFYAIPYVEWSSYPISAFA